MDWLENISIKTVVLVPTRGLQHSLSRLYVEKQIALGKSAWETPQILVWDDYLEGLWQSNKHQFSHAKVRLDQAQAFLVWQQVITGQKKQDSSLILLNEQQTANVAFRSWQLLHKWRIKPEALNEREDIDSGAFNEWCKAYFDHLNERAWTDSVQLEQQLVNETLNLKGVPEELYFVSFDLVTSSQREHIKLCEERGINVVKQSINIFDSESNEIASNKKIVYQSYEQQEDEWLSVLEQARVFLEKTPLAKIGIVIPQLTEYRSEIDQLARRVFYPTSSPLDCQQQDLAYRFSLGKPLNKVSYVYAILTSLSLLKKSFRYQDISYLLLCKWWPYKGTQEYDRQKIALTLDQAMKEKRCTWLSLHDVLAICIEALPKAEELHEYFRALIHFRESLFISEDPSDKPQFKLAREWQNVFSEWLILLNWENNDLDSWHYQAHESWLQVLETFVGYDLVQGKISLSKALLNLQSLCVDKVFMRQAKAEPILISGVLEGVGHAVDHLFVTGMHEAYPPPAPQDPFIPQTALAEQGYPFADKTKEFEYEKSKLNSLFSGGKQVYVSYSKQHSDGESSPTVLLRDQVFEPVISNGQQQINQTIELESYTDTKGQACLHSKSIKGGSRVFENQSNCPFKSYVEHRIIRRQDEDPEFGLDARDAGNIVHLLLDNIWRELVSYSRLALMGETQLREFIAKHVKQILESPPEDFQFDRLELLKLEQPRLNSLMFEWLTLEQEQRQLGFRVIGREKAIQSEYGGIPINLVIDRIDQMDSGECLVIDYKTGRAEPLDWRGERPRNPQLPLYALALERHSAEQYENIQGIAFGKVKSNDSKLVGITSIDGVSSGKDLKQPMQDRKPISWQDQLAIWHENLSQLAADFLEGEARVSPLKADTCQYCDLHSLCRVNQLRTQSGNLDIRDGM